MSRRRLAAVVALFVIVAVCAPVAAAPGFNGADLIVLPSPFVFVALMLRRVLPAGDTVPPRAATSSPDVAHPAGSLPMAAGR